MSIADNFMHCSSNLLLRKQDAIEQRQQTLMRSLNKVFWPETPRLDYCFFFGSYGRNSTSRETPVQDVMFVLPAEDYQHLTQGDAAVLNKFRAATAALFLDAKCVIESLHVALIFRDDLRFGVYPARLEANGTYTFHHPKHGEVKGYDLRAEMKAFHEMNKLTNNNLMHLGRLLRAWRKKAGFSEHSLVLDSLAYEFIRTWADRERDYLYYDLMCRDFFIFLVDKATTAPRVTVPGSKLILPLVPGLAEAANNALVLANEAIEVDRKSQSRHARQCWQQIFGDYFPA